MKQFFTKTGIELKLIQGGGQGDGIPRAQLFLVDTAQVETRVLDISLEMGQLWSCIADCLSLKQYKYTMGISRYADKARVAIKVSRSRTVREYAARIIRLEDELQILKKVG